MPPNGSGCTVRSGRAASTASTRGFGRARGNRRMTEDGITITRVFEAPRERVWREWTEPEPFADWFGGPGFEVPLSTVSMDVRPGGALRATMRGGPSRGDIQWKGQ